MAGLHILIPAAGASSRMRGADKLLETVDGVPQLRRAADAARRSGAEKVWVTLPPDESGRWTVLKGSWVKRIAVPERAEGMAASLRAGARAAQAQHAGGLMILLPDLPEITSEDLSRFVAAHREDPGSIWRGMSEDGLPGHPVLFPARLLPRFAELTGDEGARTLMEGEAVRVLALPGRRAVTDLDTPEDWAGWRALTGR